MAWKMNVPIVQRFWEIYNRYGIRTTLWCAWKYFRYGRAYFSRGVAFKRFGVTNNIESAVDTKKETVKLKNVAVHADIEYVSEENAENRESLTNVIKAIAFYLPQFHRVKENDAWWGRGFTEWINVTRALPQFKGHYQPHLPSALGFYDLENVNVLREQTSLAKKFGVYGFCFYYYWFNGRRILEKPVDAYIATQDIDFPFCICWANENWTKRWDGLDSEILLEQRYSDEDDLRFIQDLAKYILDKRYIRIHGKPLVLVYRPGLFPDAKKTAEVWREWCRNNGIGEIYLAYTQSFNDENPEVYGFDAAVEFPPLMMDAEPLSKEKLEFINPHYEGTIFSWGKFLERSLNYANPGYTLFRSVCPSWDNEARRPGRGYSFIHSSPSGYEQLLFNAGKDTVKRFVDPEERLVFINAWNEWAEGAHLEPDQKYGFSYLQATANAQKRIAAQKDSLDKQDYFEKKASIAVCLHLYYLDLWDEVVGFLRNIEVPFDLFITTPVENMEKVQKITQDCFPNTVILGTENRGRDVLPFCTLLKKIQFAEYEALLKIHTKKSTHRNDGKKWRNDLLSKLIGSPLIVQRNLELLRDPENGIVGPEGHCLTLGENFLESNELGVRRIQGALGYAGDDLKNQLFVAGTMFWCKPEPLVSLNNLDLTEDDFDPETGQVDGTLAHAIERIFGFLAEIHGLRVVETSNIPGGGFIRKIQRMYKKRYEFIG